jgi:hypothetical protein
MTATDRPAAPVARNPRREAREVAGDPSDAPTFLRRGRALLER